MAARVYIACMMQTQDSLGEFESLCESLCSNKYFQIRPHSLECLHQII